MDEYLTGWLHGKVWWYIGLTLIFFFIVRQIAYDETSSTYDVYEATLTFNEDQEEVGSNPLV